ncbi:MAG: T9SS type A sorting domain-containing protein [Lewinellaceae bacterium]|nr:T9SS type A sorting domain-containing protein [Lewinellaceae bacterium]
MQKLNLIPVFTLFFAFLNAQTPDFSIMGFATMNGGTNGGKGGMVVTPVDFDELNSYCTSDQPYIILIDREIKGSNPDSANAGEPVRRVIKMNSNKTLLGLGSSGFINQICLDINSKHNIIIRNIKFSMKDVPVDLSGSEVKILGTNTDPDIISISADLSSIPAAERITRNIWIDHCEFYNEDPSVMTDADRYDGLVDIKNDVQFVTISWCYFHDHHKGCLSGSGNSDNYDRKSTMHHNLFDNISSRIPLQRYGKLHLLNNYVVNSENGLNVRIQSEALAEKNYFKNTKKPIFGKVSEGGSASEIDNYFDNCSRLSWVHIPSASSPDADALSASEEYNPNNYVIPYDYSNYVTAVADVPDVVSEWAGIGKIPFDPMTLAIGENDDASGVTVTPSIVSDVLLISINADAGFVSLITIVDINGHVVLKKKESIVVGKNEIKLDMRHVKSGYYFCQVPTGKGTAVQKVFKRGN